MTPTSNLAPPSEPTPSAWARPHFVAGGGDALLMYFVFGKFPQPLTLSTAEYRSERLPTGIIARRHDRKTQQEVFDSLLAGYVVESLQAEDPELFAAVMQAPSCVRAQGTVSDPHDLLYLHDTLGVVTALLDNGGIAVLDLMALRWWTPREWHRSIFGPAAPVPRNHVSVLVTKESTPGTEWFHTRGMRKFGRPDVSVRDVPPDGRDGAIDLCDRLIEMQAFGTVIPDGYRVRMRSLPPGMALRHGGSYDDLDFNNVHLETRFTRRPRPPVGG